MATTPNVAVGRMPPEIAMPRPRKTTGPDGREYWVDELGIVMGEVRTDNWREDVEQYEEREQVGKLLAHWNWPPNSNVHRPAGGTYDYDCVHADNDDLVAIEIKRVMLPPEAKRELISTGSTEFKPSGFLEVPALRLAKANKQLSAATRGARRCVLLVAETELDWAVLVQGVGRANLSAYQNIDEVWLTTPNFTRFLLHPSDG
ncbi:MAG: hypothetical protein IIB22_09455 [Chloroflexi bacterium]|nr:hypothetical protein [Chloroflexota bacterium]